MIDPNKIIHVPPEELAFMDPRVREKFFGSLIEEYKKRVPTMKLKFAYLNTDSKMMLDYIVLFQARNNDDTTDLILYDAPLLFSDRSLPGYRYCLRTGIDTDFFQEAVNSMVTLSLVRFQEFINTMLHLSVNPKAEDNKYWRLPEHATVVAQGILDLSLRYVKSR